MVVVMYELSVALVRQASGRRRVLKCLTTAKDRCYADNVDEFTQPRPSVN